MASLPVIDFARWDSGKADVGDHFSPFLLDLTTVTDFQDRAAIARALVDACKNVGFAYIINTGIPEEEGELCRVPYPSATLTLILLQSVTRIFDWVGPLHLSVSSYPLSPLHPLL